MRDYVDFYGNTVHYFDIVAGHEKLVIEAISEVETTPNAARPPVPAVPTRGGCRARTALRVPRRLATTCRWTSRSGRRRRTRFRTEASDIWSDVRQICRHVYTTFAYKPRSTGVATVATEAIRLRAGVCQDFAHVALGMCRTSGIPARYVSGYFIKVAAAAGRGRGLACLDRGLRAGLRLGGL